MSITNVSGADAFPAIRIVPDPSPGAARAPAAAGQRQRNGEQGGRKPASHRQNDATGAASANDADQQPLAAGDASARLGGHPLLDKLV